MRAKLIAAALLIVPMWLLMPLDRNIRRERTRLDYGEIKVTRTIRDQVGQGTAIALLAGFRGVVADFVWIFAHENWERKEWLQQANKMQLATLLQPRSVYFWDAGAWHMAWNIGYAERVDTNNYTLAQGLKRERVWHERAAEFLQRGIENNPRRYELYFALGRLYEQKLKDDCRAAVPFGQAAAFTNAPSYVVRNYARAVEKCGDERFAYNIWRNLWLQDHEQVSQLWPVVERELRRLEDSLKLPADQRLFPPTNPEQPVS